MLLGPDVVCDGFHRARRIRVQTHVHADHMYEFETSKGFQDLLMSEGTFDLLVAEYNADLGVRANGGNLYPLRYYHPHDLESTQITLFPNQHMLGSAQVLVESDGVRLGYSSDFSWPLSPEHQMTCDALVVDGTYGSPTSVREYSQEEAEARLLELVRAKLVVGPVHLKGFRGTIHRALHLLGSEIDAPMVGGDDLCRDVAVYQRFGSVAASVLKAESIGGREAVASGRYIRFYSKGDRFPAQVVNGATIILSAFMTDRRNPVLEYSGRAYRVALTDHADFTGTVEYVRATGAQYVITDNTRGGHAIALAQALCERLGIDARPSSNHESFEWGC